MSRECNFVNMSMTKEGENLSSVGYKTWDLCFKCACLMTSTSLLTVVGVVICVKEWLSPSTWWGWVGLLTFFAILLTTSKEYGGEEKFAQAAFPLATRPYIAHQKNISGGHALSLDCRINLSLFDESHFWYFKSWRGSKIKKTSTRQDLNI